MEVFQHLQRVAALPQNIVEKATESMLVTDVNGHIWYVASALARLAGTTAGRMIGTPISKLLPDIQIRSFTPGYNMAWVAFNYPPITRRQLVFEPREGQPMLADVSISTVCMGLSHWFVLHVDPVDADD
ncbi:MAG: PAS domain S-box protein [Rhodocyclaceae bacterium]|nr:PAS domain S-box protein [Rhodocyclaceae bacterium]MBX3667306.1 PAS domain S-box protein [Rhodocyclaceae bacterium]